MRTQWLIAWIMAWCCHANTHFYDQADRLILSVHPNGEAVRYTYDDSDNITQIATLTAPRAPSELRVIRTDLKRAALSWHDNASNETGYRLMRRLSGDYHWQNVIDLFANETSYTDVDLDPDENYVYRLVALSDQAGLTSAYSNSVTAAGRGSEVFDMGEPKLDNDRLEFSFQTALDELYIVEWTTTLAEGDWTPAPFSTMPDEAPELQSLEGNGGRMTIYVDDPEADRQFYRVTRQ